MADIAADPIIGTPLVKTHYTYFEVYCTKKNITHFPGKFRQTVNKVSRGYEKVKLFKFIYATGPTKIGHVGTNYTSPHNISYLSTGIEYFYPVTFSLKPTKGFINAENLMAKQQWNTKL